MRKTSGILIVIVALAVLSLLVIGKSSPKITQNNGENTSETESQIEETQQEQEESILSENQTTQEVNLLDISLPDELTVISSNKNAIVLESENGQFRIGIGTPVDPTNTCRDYFYDTETEEETSSYISAEERETVMRYLCTPAETIEGYKFPMLSASYSYSDYASGQYARQAMAEIRKDIFRLEHRQKNAPYSIDQLSTLGENLADWADHFHVVVKINGENIVFEGPNAGGTSPIVWPSIEDNLFWVSSHERVITLYATLESILTTNLCSSGSVEQYFSSLREDEPTPSTKEKFAKDLSCLGDITFTSATFGMD